MLLAVPSVGLAQQTGTLAGTVRDTQGAVLPGVTVVVRHQESGLFRETVSGADGSFLMSAMTPGVYEVAAELSGFKKYARRDVRLEVGRTAQVNIELEVGGLTEAVTVSAEAPLVDTTSQEIGGHISAQEFVDTRSRLRHDLASVPKASRPMIDPAFDHRRPHVTATAAESESEVNPRDARSAICEANTSGATEITDPEVSSEW